MVGRDTSPVTILGTGALAMRFGAALARSGRRVTLVGTWPDGLAAIQAGGIAVDAGSTVWTVPASASRLGDGLAPAPLVLVLVKAHQTRAVAPHAAALATPDGLILTLQNGLGNRETLADAAGPERVSAGVTSEGASVLGPGYVRIAGAGVTTVGTAGDTARAARRAAMWLREAGLTVETSDDIDALLWRKLAVNAAINPLTALHMVPNGALLEDPKLTTRMAAAAREVGRVAEAAGVVLGADPVSLAREVASMTADNRSSMLQDVTRGGLTEIDAICGAVVRIGRRLGIDTPVNLRLWRAVSELGGEVVDGTGTTLRQTDFGKQLGLQTGELKPAPLVDRERDGERAGDGDGDGGRENERASEHAVRGPSFGEGARRTTVRREDDPRDSTGIDRVRDPARRDDPTPPRDSAADPASDSAEDTSPVGERVS